MIFGIVLTALLLLFLIKFPRFLKPVVSIIAVIWIVMAGLVFYDWTKSSERRELLIGSAKLDPSCTDPNLPLLVTFDNRSDAPTAQFTYRIEGFLPAFRAPVTLDAYQTANVRIEAGASYSACRAFRMKSSESADPAKLEWRVSVESALFR
jgi:hypothetical protein